jgi:glyoxylase-like metal-dependent hydrolase (beta-lactamase superfamily II)
MAGLITQFNPRVLSWLPLAGTTERLSDGMHLRLGDHDAVVLHTPGHSADSVCLFQADTGSLFSGDTLVSIHDSQGRYSQEYLESLLRLSRLDIRTIYPGHGPPISEGAMAYIRTCCTHVGRSLGTDPRADGQ